MITDELRERAKLLVAYDEYKAQTDAVTGYDNFDFPISRIEVSGYVVTITLPDGRYFFLPVRNYHIIEKEREERRLEQEKERRLEQERLEKEREEEELRRKRAQQEKEEKEEAFLKNHGERLERVARQAANKKLSSDKEGKIDGAAWWTFMETYYPRNYGAANAFYHDKEESPIIKRFLSIAPDATVNDFFPAIGLPTIKAVDGKISVNDEVVASYDGFRINMRGEKIQYRHGKGGTVWR